MTDFSLEALQRGPDTDESPAVRRGRRTQLEDCQLHNRRGQLVQAFESSWGEIGWELQKCKKTEDLIRIFTPLSENYMRDMISVFCRATTETPSATRLRKMRAELLAVIEPRYNAEKSKREAQEYLQQADSALMRAIKGDRRMVRRERKNRRKEFAKAAQAQRSLSESQGHLEMQLRGLEASFARQQLFRFLKSKRYELTPLNLAHAAAGLPYMGWRQSMRRCTKASCMIANGLMYQIFKAVRYLVKTAKAKTQDALLDRFRNGIPSLPSRYQLPQVKLAEDWLYLDRAVRQSCRAKPHPKALPFEIAKRYFRQIQSQSQVDIVLAQQARLDLSK